MSPFKTLRALTLGFGLSLAFAASAFAQSTILVVDTQKVLKESTVGQHVARQLEAIYSSAQSEMKAKASPLESTGKSLQAQLQTKTSMQDLQSDTGLQAQIKRFETDKQAYKVEEYYTANELKVTEAKAIGLVSQRVKTIIDQIARERSADVVLEKSLVIYGDPADVTDLVISRLNSQMTTVPVARERLPRKG
jgi:outer membrane protein